MTRKKTYAGLLIIIAVMLSCITGSFSVKAQEPILLTLDSCYALAKNNYPLIKQMSLIEKSQEYSIDNASKGYLPQIMFNGQATYQSAVTRLPISLPGGPPTLSKDQYKIYGEINQSLTDVYAINQQKELIKANTVAEEQKLEVELYKLKDRINQLFFGILLLDAQLEQTELVKKDINTGIKRTDAAIANGVALKSNADILQAELLKADQRAIELKSNRKGFVDMLAIFINQTIDENTKLVSSNVEESSNQINRPELKFYDVQKMSFDIQNKLITAKNIPKLSLFFQGGYGRPTLNLLNNNFSFYYIGGLRLSWSLSGLYTAKGEKGLLGLNQKSLDVQKETFLFNTNLALKQQNSEIDKLLALINTDSQIISLREKVKTTANNQLENGTITPTDYLSYVNAEDQARQNQILHQVQLALAQCNYKTTSGN